LIRLMKDADEQDDHEKCDAPAFTSRPHSLEVVRSGRF